MENINSSVEVGGGGPAVQNSALNDKKVAKKHNNVIIAVVVLVVLAAIGVGFGVYGMLSSSSRIADLEKQVTERDETIAQLRGDGVGTEGEDDAAGGDSRQPLARKLLISSLEQFLNKNNGNGILTLLSANLDFIGVRLEKQLGTINSPDGSSETVEPIHTKLTGSVYYDEMHGGRVFDYLNRAGVEDFEISNIDVGKIVDMAIYGFGQAVGYETLFFLMEDGTVEYMPVFKAVENRDYRSYGKLPKVDNGIKFMNLSFSDGFTGFSHDGIVQQADGIFYRLYQLLGEAGVYQ